MPANAATDPSHETRWICPLSESVVIPARGGSSDLLWAWTSSWVELAPEIGLQAGWLGFHTSRVNPILLSPPCRRQS